jgi:hypothetical protein
MFFNIPVVAKIAIACMGSAFCRDALLLDTHVRYHKMPYNPLSTKMPYNPPTTTRFFRSPSKYACGAYLRSNMPKSKTQLMPLILFLLYIPPRTLQKNLLPL